MKKKQIFAVFPLLFLTFASKSVATDADIDAERKRTFFHKCVELASTRLSETHAAVVKTLGGAVIDTYAATSEQQDSICLKLGMACLNASVAPIPPQLLPSLHDFQKQACKPHPNNGSSFTENVICNLPSPIMDMAEVLKVDVKSEKFKNILHKRALEDNHQLQRLHARMEDHVRSHTSKELASMAAGSSNPSYTIGNEKVFLDLAKSSSRVPTIVGYDLDLAFKKLDSLPANTSTQPSFTPPSVPAIKESVTFPREGGATIQTKGGEVHIPSPISHNGREFVWRIGFGGSW